MVEERIAGMGEAAGNVGSGVSGVDADGTPAFTLTAKALKGLVKAAVSEALCAAEVALIDKQQLAKRLCCSAAHIDALRKEGLPTVKVGVAVRFEADKVLDWLRTRKADNDTE